jgi:hypothetical protein
VTPTPICIKDNYVKKSNQELGGDVTQLQWINQGLGGDVTPTPICIKDNYVKKSRIRRGYDPNSNMH